MDYKNYTVQQKCAVELYGTNIIVSAGAGSGKTAVLTERVSYFIKNHKYKLSEFLILTFTKLAAGEMKERIRKKLTEEGLEDANEVDTALICTFDSYALSLVKKYHLLLNVSANVSMVDSTIIDVKKRKIINRLLEEEAIKQEPSFLDLVKRLCFKDYSNFVDFILKFYEFINLKIDKYEYLDNYLAKYHNEEMYEKIMDLELEPVLNYHQSIVNMFESLENTPLGKKDTRLLKDTVYDIFRPLIEADTYDKLMKAVKITDFELWPKKKDTRRTPIKKVFSLMKKICDELPLTKQEYFDSLSVYQPLATKMIEIVKKLDKEIVEFKEKYQTFEFEDIAKKAYQLVKENLSIREEIKHSFKMIMIDEYQDTSELQDSFISLIQNDNVYMVGDVKQSIYRFRNARVDLFIKKYNEYNRYPIDETDEDIEVGQRTLKGLKNIAIDMNKNFRSRKECLDDINYIFKQIMTDKCGGANYAQSHKIEYGNKSFITNGMTGQNQNTEIIIYPESESKDTAEVEASLIARDIIDKINSKYLVMGEDKDGKLVTRPCRFSDFTILMDRGTTFSTYLKVFNEYKLPLFVENDENIYTTRIVMFFYNVLSLVKDISSSYYRIKDRTKIYNKDFKNHFYGVLRSFVVGYNDQKILEINQKNDFDNNDIILKLKELIVKNHNNSCLTLLKEIIYEFNIYEKFVSIGNIEKNEIYIDLFLSFFENMEKLDYTLDDFIDFLDSLKEYKLKLNLPSVGSSLDSVKIMNYHKSKGLEFNIIYFSGLTKRFNNADLRSEYGISDEYGLFFPRYNKKENNIVKITYSKTEYDEESSEIIRKIYVALTRVKEKMIMVVPIEMTKYFKLYSDYSTEKYTRYIVSNSFFDLDINEQIKIIYKDYQAGDINILMLERLLSEIDVEELAGCFIEGCTLEEIEEKYQQLLDAPIQEEITEEINDEEFIEEEEEEPIDEELLRLSQVMSHYSRVFHNVIDGDSKKYEEVLRIRRFYTINILEKVYPVKLRREVRELLAREEELPEYYYNAALFETPILEYDRENEIEINLRGFLDYCQKNDVQGFDKSLTLLGILRCLPYDNIIPNLLVNAYDNKVTIDVIESEIKWMNYDLSAEGKTFICELLLKGYDKNKEVITPEQFVEYFLPKNELIKDLIDLGNPTNQIILQRKYQMFLKNDITLEELKDIANLYGFEFTVHFDKSSLQMKYMFDIENIDDVFVEKGKIIDDFSKANNLLGYLEKVIEYRKFNQYIVDLDCMPKEPVIPFAEVKEEKLEIRKVDIVSNEIEINRASKDLDLNVDKKKLEFGTNIHFVMEMMDFKNPDYSVLDSFYAKIVRTFLDSKLMENIMDGHIYKEYEFYDEVNNLNGIIDLMIIYGDYIDIIDYKTKNIDDKKYEDQLMAYKQFIERIFNKTTKVYLYSLIDGVYVECCKKIVI